MIATFFMSNNFLTSVISLTFKILQVCIGMSHSLSEKQSAKDVCRSYQWA